MVNYLGLIFGGDLRFSRGVRYLFSTLILIVFTLFFTVILNIDESINPDYKNYRADYLGQWGQFEFFYSALTRCFYSLNISFELFWLLLLGVESLLLVLLYRKFTVLIFALPNVYYLADGILGIQVRFSIAILIALNLIVFMRGKLRFLLVGLTTGFHHAAVFLLGLSTLCSRVDSTSWFWRNKHLFLFLLFVFFGLTSFFSGVVLDALGYGYYLNSKYLEPKSLVSIIYIAVSLFLTLLVLNSFYLQGEGRLIVALASLVLILCLAFSGVAIISGRYLGVYMILEPLVLIAYLRVFGNKTSYLPVTILFFALYCSKFLGG